MDNILTPRIIYTFLILAIIIGVLYFFVIKPKLQQDPHPQPQPQQDTEKIIEQEKEESNLEDSELEGIDLIKQDLEYNII